MAFRHVVMWRIEGERGSFERQTKAEAAATGLVGLRGNVPALVDLWARPNQIEDGENWDLVMIAEFKDRDSLEEFHKDPAFLGVKNYLDEVTTEKAVVDFWTEAPDAFR